VQLGIPKQRILSLRDGTFAQSLLVITEDRGVDVVLNSLTGGLLHASWQCVAEFGMMVDLAEHSRSRGQLGIDFSEAIRAFVAVDIAQISAKRPEIIQG
jgi:NADPH:quinone reductase-like Zn-dependent oxidoreductase